MRDAREHQRIESSARAAEPCGLSWGRLQQREGRFARTGRGFLLPAEPSSGPIRKAQNRQENQR